MATSFNGWGSSWGQTWDRISDPNAMYGSASIVVSATGTLTNGQAPEVVAPWPSIPIPVRKVMRRRHEEDEALLLAAIL